MFPGETEQVSPLALCRRLGYSDEMKTLIRMGLIAAACSCVGPSLAAGWAVEQALKDSTFQILYSSPVWQSFTVSPSTIDRIEVSLVNLNGQLPYEKTVTLRLYEGQGLGGSLRYSRTVEVPQAVIFSGVGWVPFDMGVRAYTQDGVYTFELVAQTERFGVEVYSGNAYANGRAHFVDPVTGANFGEAQDLRFRVMTSIPDLPTVWTLLCGGLLLVGRFRASPI